MVDKRVERKAAMLVVRTVAKLVALLALRSAVVTDEMKVDRMEQR